MVHSPGIDVMDFFVHDGFECPCGKTRCGSIAGSDHYFLTATLDLQRPADSLLTPRWSWNKGIDWGETLNGFKVHFTLLASWINSITCETRCANREERQALINCISFAWYVTTYGALAHASKWHQPKGSSGKKPSPWWDLSCDKAANRFFQNKKNTSSWVTAKAHYRSQFNAPGAATNYVCAFNSTPSISPSSPEMRRRLLR